MRRCFACVQPVWVVLVLAWGLGCLAVGTPAWAAPSAEVRALIAAAEDGDVHAMYDLGHCYLRGEGVAKNEKRGYRWIVKAAEQDYEPAQYSAGVCSYHGEGTRVDHGAAAKWFRKAADAGHPRGMYSLGWLYADGEGVAASDKRAFRWMNQAAEAGVEDAWLEVGYRLYNGHGTRADPRARARAKTPRRPPSGMSKRPRRAMRMRCLRWGRFIPTAPG